jgi:hypothetical protein
VIGVEALDGDAVGVAIGGLGFVQVEAGREEEHRLTAGSHQRLIDVGGDTAGAGQDAEGGSL